MMTADRLLSFHKILYPRHISPSPTKSFTKRNIVMPKLTLQKAAAIVESALSHAAGLQLNPLTVAVLDAGGHLIAFQRQDGSSIMRPEIAQGKAWGALAMGMGGRALTQRAEQSPAFFVSLASVSKERMVVPGGVLIKDVDGEIIGAVGISGVHPDMDEACAISGIKAAGLVAEP
jgi:uncharacterized protein GlcG (DUF336 family)